MSRPASEFFKLFSQIENVSLVETGTQHGKGIREFLACGFTRVHSIEAFKDYYDNVTRVMAKEIEAGRVTLHFGPSETTLKPVIDSIDGPIVYWLDAHFQGTDIDALHCPLNEELDAIYSHEVRDDDVILIDDVRMIVNQRSWRGHEVDFNAVIGKLMTRLPNHFSCFVDGHTPNDVFCVVPKKLAAQFFAAMDASVQRQELEEAA